MPKARSKRCTKRKFYGNRFSVEQPPATPAKVLSASESKLKDSSVLYGTFNRMEDTKELFGNRIFDLQTLVSLFSLLCCPNCLATGLKLVEDSKFGLCSNFSLHCERCSFIKGFSSTPKVNNCGIVNKCFVLGLRLIGRGYTAGQKLCSALSLPCLSKCSFRDQETTLLDCVKSCAQENMSAAAREVRAIKNVPTKTFATCGVSVDGTWQRRGYSSLNGCTSVISVDNGKVLDVEIMSQYCRICKDGRYSQHNEHDCSKNHTGSSGNMEVVGVSRMFARSEDSRKLQYTQYYGDGDSKAFDTVSDMYGKSSVEKLECIGHVQKRVGGRLRKLKKSKKGLGGKGKLTDKFIDKLQNYYGIAIRSNVGNLKNMQCAVIAAFCHCCSGYRKQMHGQCPKGADSWCRFQKAEFVGKKIEEKAAGLPSYIINTIKSTYMGLCDQKLLKKCLHGLTQNNNESFNGVVWNIVPKETFVELKTLSLGVYLGVILFNSGYSGLLPVISQLKMPVSREILDSFCKIDKTRIADSKRHSLPVTKLSRKKRRAVKKNKSLKDEDNEGITYGYGIA